MDKNTLYYAWFHVIEGMENLHKSALYYKSLLARHYGKGMTARECQDSIQQRERLTTVIDALTDYLAYDEERLSELREKSFAFTVEANAAMDELLRKP